MLYNSNMYLFEIPYVKVALKSTKIETSGCVRVGDYRCKL